jgi:hypothetical protein
MENQLHLTFSIYAKIQKKLSHAYEFSRCSLLAALALGIVSIVSSACANTVDVTFDAYEMSWTESLAIQGAVQQNDAQIADWLGNGYTIQSQTTEYEGANEIFPGCWIGEQTVFVVFLAPPAPLVWALVTPSLPVRNDGSPCHIGIDVPKTETRNLRVEYIPAGSPPTTPATVVLLTPPPTSTVPIPIQGKDRQWTYTIWRTTDGTATGGLIPAGSTFIVTVLDPASGLPIPGCGPFTFIWNN